MEYHTVYDLGSHGFNFSPLLLAIMLAFLSLALMSRARVKGVNPVLARGIFVLSILFADFSVAMPYLEYSRLSSALKDGQTQVADGYISHHMVKPRISFNDSSWAKLAGASQSFSVDGVSFDWSVSEFDSSLFSKKANLALRDGQALRVTYVEDGEGSVVQRRILRLELAEEDVKAGVAAL